MKKDQIKKVIIAVDDSLEILAQGLELAYEMSAWATVVRAIPTWEGELNLTGVGDPMKLIQSDLDEQRKKIQGVVQQSGVKAKIQIIQGDPAEVLTMAAHNEKADLIIIGDYKGHPLMGDIFDINLPKRVARKSSCYTLLLAPRNIPPLNQTLISRFYSFLTT